MKNVYSVTQVNAYIKNMFAQDYMLRSITVSGEVSNVKYHTSGHIYFTMKDKNSAIACVMFAGNAKGLKVRLVDGLAVESVGFVGVYERDGKYQLYVNDIRKAGIGELYEKYEALKEELREMGMFDDMYKKDIPRYAKRIGIVTASTGAAIRDIMEISRRRNPYVQLYLYPAQVQGEGAKESLVRGIKNLENFGVDVIIVGRGGGSIEDLWAFNEKCVAQAIFDCSIPIVSAVGHESDTTIADYVADRVASTPSAAAEMTVFEIDQFVEDVAVLKSTVEHYMHLKLIKKRQDVQNCEKLLKGFSPAARIREKRILNNNMKDKLDRLMMRKLESSKHQVLINIERLKAANPLDKLEKGYAFVADENGKSVRDIDKIKVGDELNLHLKGGIVKTSVRDIDKKGYGDNNG